MPFLVERCCGGDTEKVLGKTGEQRRQGVLMQFFSVSEPHCQQLLLLPENADSDCRRQNCCFYSLHRCKREKPDETRSHNCVHEKSRAFETQGPSNPHTSTERVPGNWTVLSVISFLACASMQMHSKDDVSRWQSAITMTAI